MVNNSARTSVQVDGTNSGNITVQSTNRVSIVEGAQSSARSGNSLAAPAGTPVPTISQVATPSLTNAAGPTSAPATKTGLTAQNQVNLQATMTAVPAPSATGTVTINQSAQAVIQNSAGSVATSQPVSASPATPTPTKVAPLTDAAPSPTAALTATTTVQPAATPANQTPTPQPKNASHASSGSAEATGLIAQNVVNTNADVNVTVHGQNKGLIKVIVQSITQIFNFGWAMASSGDTIAMNGGAPGTATSTTAASPITGASGHTRAVGAKVTNDVNINNSTSVKVAGDNHNPINLFVDLFAWIGNAGYGWAQSGDAQANGVPGSSGQSSGEVSAQSGSARATGLDATNHVNMSASAAVDVEGSNYADIFVQVRFFSYIWNQGAALAASGNSRSINGPAGSTTAAPGTRSSGATSSGSTSGDSNSGGSSGGSSFQSALARSGDAQAMGQNSSLQIASAQYANGNGSGPGFNVELPPISNALPDPPATPTVDPKLSGTLQPLLNMVAGVQAQSGNASSSGFQTGDSALNVQISHAANPGSDQATATNSFEFNASTTGNSSASTGFAGVNATPTPVPTPSSQGSGGSNSRSESRGHSSSQSVENYLELYQVNWAGGNPPAEGFHSQVKVGIPSQWPEWDQPPMPAQLMVLAPRVEGTAPRIGRAWSELTAPIVTAWSDVNPLGIWPKLELPPMPGQSAGRDQSGPVPAFGNPDGGMRGPLEAFIWSILGMMTLGAVGSRRGRNWMTMWAQSWLRQAMAAARLIMGLILS